MLPAHAKQAAVNLKKARGQVDRVLVMAEEGRYCMDLIQQCNAAIGLLQQANQIILDSHLQTCGRRLAAKDKAVREKFTKEILRAFAVSRRK